VEDVSLGSQAMITDRIDIGVHWEQRALAEANHFEGWIVRDEYISEGPCHRPGFLRCESEVSF